MTLGRRASATSAEGCQALGRRGNEGVRRLSGALAFSFSTLLAAVTVVVVVVVGACCRCCCRLMHCCCDCRCCCRLMHCYCDCQTLASHNSSNRRHDLLAVSALARCSDCRCFAFAIYDVSALARCSDCRCSVPAIACHECRCLALALAACQSLPNRAASLDHGRTYATSNRLALQTYATSNRLALEPDSSIICRLVVLQDANWGVHALIRSRLYAQLSTKLSPL